MNIAKQCLVESLEIRVEVINAKLQILEMGEADYLPVEEAKNIKKTLLKKEKKILEKNLERLKSDKPRGSVKS